MLQFINALPVAPTQPNKEAIQYFFMRPPANAEGLIKRLLQQYGRQEIQKAKEVCMFLYPDHYEKLTDYQLLHKAW
jgi:hypothetical protein